MNHAEQAYTHADKAVHHYLRLLGGSLSPAQRHEARLALIRAVFHRARARVELGRSEYREVVEV